MIAIFLLPMPKNVAMKEGSFYLSRDTEIILDDACGFAEFETARLLQSEIVSVAGFKAAITKSFDKKTGSILLRKLNTEDNGRESYSLEIDQDGIVISGAEAGLFYGVQTLRQIVRQQGVTLNCLSIDDAPYFENRGFYHDVTRGKVPTLETLKDLVDRLSFYKINQLQLYIEHTFAFRKMSEVWTGKDPLTAEEILELDAYCQKRNIELVPSLSTFGHLYEVLSTKTYSHLCELEGSEELPFAWYNRMAHHTLDVTNEGSIKLVEEMLEEFIPLFSSDKFNICGDETFDLGKGKSAKLAKELGTGRIYLDFIKKIMAVVEKHNKTVMFWSDIIVKHPEYLKEVPENTVLLNWAYHASVVEDDTKAIAESGADQYVCPGVSGWNMLMNAMDNAFENIRKMVSYGKKYGALGVLNTDWGDYGHVNLFANSMPGMIYGAALSWNPDDEREFAVIDRAVSQIEFGKDSIVPLMRKLSRYDMGCWSKLVWWKEYKHLDNENIGKRVKGLAEKPDEVFKKAYSGALELEREIAIAAIGIPENRKLDVSEALVSARGIALMNAAVLAMKKYEAGCPDTELLMDNAVLAEKLEYWFFEYGKLWRSRNKESELYRIRETIEFVCDQLRSNR